MPTFGKTMETIKDGWLPGVREEGGMNRRSIQIFVAIKLFYIS
jgi:hypothetical protein